MCLYFDSSCTALLCCARLPYCCCTIYAFCSPHTSWYICSVSPTRVLLCLAYFIHFHIRGFVYFLYAYCLLCSHAHLFAFEFLLFFFFSIKFLFAYFFFVFILLPLFPCMFFLLLYLWFFLHFYLFVFIRLCWLAFLLATVVSCAKCVSNCNFLIFQAWLGSLTRCRLFN